MDGLWSAAAWLAMLWVVWRYAHQLAETERAKAEAAVACARAAHDSECMRLINELRADEGWMVEIVCDNPEFGAGPNCVVGVFGEWPMAEGRQWATRNFTSDSLLDCLRIASEARKLRAAV